MKSLTFKYNGVQIYMTPNMFLDYLAHNPKTLSYDKNDHKLTIKVEKTREIQSEMSKEAREKYENDLNLVRQLSSGALYIFTADRRHHDLIEAECMISEMYRNQLYEQYIEETIVPVEIVENYNQKYSLEALGFLYCK